jgi:hypothetical protein
MKPISTVPSTASRNRGSRKRKTRVRVEAFQGPVLSNAAGAAIPGQPIPGNRPDPEGAVQLTSLCSSSEWTLL